MPGTFNFGFTNLMPPAVLAMYNGVDLQRQHRRRSPRSPTAPATPSSSPSTARARWSTPTRPTPSPTTRGTRAAGTTRSSATLYPLQPGLDGEPAEVNGRVRLLLPRPSRAASTPAAPTSPSATARSSSSRTRSTPGPSAARQHRPRSRTPSPTDRPRRRSATPAGPSTCYGSAQLGSLPEAVDPRRRARVVSSDQY